MTRIDRIRDDAAGVNAFQAHACKVACTDLKIPPRHAILCAHNGGRGPNERFDLRRELRKTVSLHAKKDNVDRTAVVKVPDHPRSRGKFLAGTAHTQTFLLHGPQMRTASEKRHVFA